MSYSGMSPEISIALHRLAAAQLREAGEIVLAGICDCKVAELRAKILGKPASQ